MKPVLSFVLSVTMLSVVLFAADKTNRAGKKGQGKENVTPDKKETGGKLRTWTDKTGKFKVKAKFIELKDGDVVLETDEGKSVTLPLDKLSKDDQKVAHDLAKEADENPFKAADENPFEAGSKKSGDDSSADGGTADEMTDVDWSQIETLTPGETSQWSFTPDAQPQLDKPLWSKPIILASTLKGKGAGAGGQLNFFENIDGLLFDRAQGRAYAVIHDAAPGKPHVTGIQRIDLISGKVQDPMVLTSKLKPVDVDPSGSLIVARSDHMFESNTTPGLSVWKLGEKALKHVRSWSPVEPGDFHKSAPSFAQFVDADHLLSVAFPGKLVMWNVSRPKALYKMEISGNSKPAVSAGNKYFAAAAKNGVFVFQAATGESVGRLPGDPGVVTAVSFSPDGRQLAAVSQQRLIVWDLEKGELYRDIYFPQPNHASDIDWVGKGFVLLGGERLVDLDKRTVLWQYQHEAGRGTHHGYGEMGGEFWYALTSQDRKQRGLFHVRLPHEDALKTAKSLDADQLLAVRPGVTASISVNLQGAPAEQQQVQQALTDQLQKLGINVAANAPLVLQANTETGKTQDITYRKFGFRGNETARVTEQIARVKFVENSKILWETVSVGGAPMMLQMKQGQTLQDALAPYQKPNTQFFSTVKLPQYVARPGEAVAYGASSLSAQGVQNVPLKPTQPGGAGR